ncbi:DHH family phosphoesterase, partial [Candidatus Woesearchaeota archaeon]|nr:DHH family phosphoesterase [Candidatus Woesearchaeota archaeon]
EDLYLDNPLATLIRVVNFNLKGNVSETLRGVENFRKVKEPQEILEQTSEAGAHLWEKYEKYAQEYDKLLAKARLSAEENADDSLLIFIYESEHNSFTSELSNELLIRYPNKIVVVGRHDRGEVKASLRAGPNSPDVDVPLKVSVDGLRGYGGGHKKACGTCIHEDDWPIFLERFRENLALSDDKD